MLGDVKVDEENRSKRARMNSAHVWDLEYSKVKSIPSSHRIEASHALRKATTTTNFLGSKALDLGCGNGRNSIFLQKLGFNVDALDFSQVALRLAAENIDTHGSPERANLVYHDLFDGIPYDNRRFDLVLDAYCTCHLIDPIEYSETLDEINRVLAVGGVYVRIHLDSSDQYYKERIHSRDEVSQISYNQENNTYKRHFSVGELAAQFDSRLWSSESLQVSFDDFVGGEKYQRSVSVVVSTKL